MTANTTTTAFQAGDGQEGPDRETEGPVERLDAEDALRRKLTFDPRFGRSVPFFEKLPRRYMDEQHHGGVSEEHEDENLHRIPLYQHFSGRVFCDNLRFLLISVRPIGLAPAIFLSARLPVHLLAFQPTIEPPQSVSQLWLFLGLLRSRMRHRSDVQLPRHLVGAMARALA